LERLEDDRTQKKKNSKSIFKNRIKDYSGETLYHGSISSKPPTKLDGLNKQAYRINHSSAAIEQCYFNLTLPQSNLIQSYYNTTVNWPVPNSSG